MKPLRILLTVGVALALNFEIASAQVQPRVKAAFFAMTVSSMDSTIAWYQDKLGLEVRRRGSPGRNIEQAHLVSPWLELELFGPRDMRPIPRNSNAVGVAKVGVFLDRASYTAILARLRERSAKFIGREIDEADGSRFFMVEDNNGLAIQIFMVP